MNRRDFIKGLTIAPAIAALAKAESPCPPYRVGDLVRINRVNGWDFHWNNETKPLRRGPDRVGGKTGIIGQVSQPCESNKERGPSYSIHPIGAWFHDMDISLITRGPEIPDSPR